MLSHHRCLGNISKSDSTNTLCKNCPEFSLVYRLNLNSLVWYVKKFTFDPCRFPKLMWLFLLIQKKKKNRTLFSHPMCTMLSNNSILLPNLFSLPGINYLVLYKENSCFKYLLKGYRLWNSSLTLTIRFRLPLSYLCPRVFTSLHCGSCNIAI